jgi:hypothetical protein
MQEIYEAAVHAEATGDDQDASFELLCKLEDVGGTGATIRKLIDMVRAHNREAQPVYQMRLIDGSPEQNRWVEVTHEEFNLPLKNPDEWSKRVLSISPPEASVLAQPVSQGSNSPVIPDGWVMVPKEPTESMVIDGFESEPDKHFSDPEEWKKYKAMSGCRQAAHRAKLCWEAMISAAPKPEGGNG